MYQPLGVGIRQRPQQNPVNDAEDRGVGADAESERQNEGQRKARCFPKTPYCNSYLHHVIVSPMRTSRQVAVHTLRRSKSLIHCVYGRAPSRFSLFAVRLWNRRRKSEQPLVFIHSAVGGEPHL